jgi:hypothetical protein
MQEYDIAAPLYRINEIIANPNHGFTIYVSVKSTATDSKFPAICPWFNKAVARPRY